MPLPSDPGFRATLGALVLIGVQLAAVEVLGIQSGGWDGWGTITAVLRWGVGLHWTLPLAFLLALAALGWHVCVER